MGLPDAASYGTPSSSSTRQPSSSSRKRIRTPPQTKVVDLTEDTPPKRRKKSAKPSVDEHLNDIAKSRSAKQAKTSKDEEKRLRRWRKAAPTSYLEVRDRALTQRMFVLDRQRDNSNPEHPAETVSIAGTTGNVYQITIDKVPSCSCPHALKGNQCKHIAYVLARVLRVPAELQYQLAFVSTELREIFAKAPPLPSETAEKETHDGNRKPLEGECPLCSEDFDLNSLEAIVYCKASCGNNIHRSCFQQWSATKGGGSVPCPFCRTPWQQDEADATKNVVRNGRKNAEGYVNVASQLGLSGDRDYSTYNQWWLFNKFRRG
ncbi:hypothetical protein MBLNU230_g5148t1 [Neophaeotheca triangularis]